MKRVDKMKTKKLMYKIQSSRNFDFEKFFLILATKDF